MAEPTAADFSQLEREYIERQGEAGKLVLDNDPPSQTTATPLDMESLAAAPAPDAVRYESEKSNILTAVGTPWQGQLGVSLLASGVHLAASGAGKFQGWLDDHDGVSTFGRRFNNVAELVLGNPATWLQRPQQALYAGLVGEGWSGIKKRMFPEVTKNVLGTEDTDEDTEFHGTWAQLNDMLHFGIKAAMGDEGARQGLEDALDTEPVIMERAGQGALTSKDVMDHALGSAGATDAVMSALEPSNRERLQIGLLGLDFVADPLMVAPTPASIVGKVRFAKNAAKLGVAGAHGVEADRAVSAAARASTSVKGDALKKASLAVDATAKEVKRHEKIVADAIAAGKVTAKDAALLARAEKRKAVAEQVLSFQREGASKPIILPESPRRNPFSPLDDNKVIAQFDQSEIPQLKGFPGKGRIEHGVKLLNRDLADPAQAPQLTKDLQQKLTPDVYAHLRNQGAALPDNPREQALSQLWPLQSNMYVSDPKTGKIVMKFEVKGATDNIVTHPDDFAKLIQHGPSPGTHNAQSAFYAQLGADPSDLTFFEHVTPFHQRLERTVDGPLRDTRAERLWIGSGSGVPGTKKATAPDFFKQFPGLDEFYQPGLSEGNHFGSVFNGLNHLRESRRALPGFKNGKQILLNLNSGSKSMDQEAAAARELVGRTLKESGVGDYKGATFHTTDKAKARQIWDLLDMPIGKAEDMPDWHKRFTAAYDAADPSVQRAHDALRSHFNEWARQLGLPDNLHISGYAPHIFTEANLPPDLLLATKGYSNTAAGKVVFHAMDPRIANLPGYEKDLTQALDYYIHGFSKKIHMEPAFKRSQDLAIESGSADTVYYTSQLLDNMQGKPGKMDVLIDRLASNLPEKFKTSPAHRNMLAAHGLLYSGYLAGNIPFVLANLGTASLVNTAKFGLLSSARGVLSLATKEGRARADRLGVSGEFTKLIDSIPGEKLWPGLKQMHAAAEKANKYGGGQWSENVARSWAVNAYLSDLERSTGKSLHTLHEEGLLDAAMRDALNASEELHHTYGPLGRVPAIGRFGRTIESPGTMFLSFGPKSAEMLADKAVNDQGMLMKYFAYSGAVQRLAASQLGLDVNQFTGLGFAGQMVPDPDKDKILPTSVALQTMYANIVASAYLTAQMTGQAPDPAKAKEAYANFRKMNSKMIPLSNGVRNAFKTAQELDEGWRVDSQQRPLMKLNAKRDIASVLTRLPSSHQQKFQQRMQTEVRQRAQNDAAMKMELMDDIFTGMRDGDSAKVAAAKDKAARLGLKLSKSGVKARWQALATTRLLREMRANPAYTKLFEKAYSDSLSFQQNVRKPVQKKK